MCIILYFFPLHPICSENNKSIPSVAQKNTYPQVMIKLSHLSIDFRLAAALQGEWKLVKEGSSDQFTVQESGGCWDWICC